MPGLAFVPIFHLAENASQSPMNSDTTCSTTASRQTQNPASKIEREANRFASELLIPENLVRKTITQLTSLGLKNINPIEEISWAFKVSKEAMQIRLKNLKIIA
jgi:Zn-dependent peptidase ImmA (M78 family)